MLVTRGMTLHAILEIGDAFFQMFRADIRFVVFVATVAGVGRERARMTSDAGRYSVLAMIQREGVRLIKLRGSPGCSGVAGGAVHAKQSKVEHRVGMATNALRGRPRKLCASMTLLALQAFVRARQREGATRVIEIRVVPIVCVVAGRAVRAKLAIMFVVARVTGITIISKKRVVYAGVLPIRWVMTSRAVRSKAAIVFVIARMAGIAIGGRSREDIVLMAIFATRVDVFALQLECGQAVIELGGSPRFGAVTHRAVRTEAAFVGVILRVARETVRGRGGKVGSGAHVHVALGAIDLGVLAVQFEIKVVRKLFSEAIHAIVTGETLRAILDDVRLHKPRVDLLMTGRAILQIKCSDSLRVAIGTQKRITRDCERVTRQREAQRLMRKIGQRGIGKRRISASMIGMTMDAFEIRVVVRDAPMQ